MRLPCLLLMAGLVLAVEQPVLLPLPALMRRLDAQQEWLLLPLAEYQRLVAAGREPAPLPRGASAFISSARVTAAVVDGREIALTAELTAVNRGDGPGLADLFAVVPERLGAVRLDGVPAVLAMGAPVRLLLPRPGRFAVSVQWTVPLAGSIQRRSGRLPLPLAGGLALTLAGDGRGLAIADGLVRDASGWRLVAPASALLDLAWLPGGSGDDAPVFGAEQTLSLQVQPGPRPVHWEVSLASRRGALPQVLSIVLPPGFSCTAARSGVARLVPTAGGIEITRSADAPTFAIDGLLAAGAAMALPRIDGASWQGGTVRLDSTAAIACDPPAGWRPLGGDAASRSFAVQAPDAGMLVAPLAVDAAISISTSTAVAVGPERSTLEEVLLIRAGGTRLFHLPLQLPAGWRVTALRGAGINLPPVEDLVAGSGFALDLPAGLPPGAELELLFTAEAAGGPPPPAMPLGLSGDVRASHRLLIAAAPGIELAMSAPGWRLLQDEGVVVPGLRAELRSDGEATPVALTATPRAAAVDVDAVGWLLPGLGGTWCRFDVRVAVRDGELSRFEVDLPLRQDGELRLSGDGLVLGGQGPFTISSPKPWRGERLLRIEGRLRAEAEGRLPLIDVRLPGSARPPVLRRWLALQAPGERDVQPAATTVARPIDADELPAWAQPVPGAAILAAWRLGAGDPGGWQTADRPLAPVPDGFIDALELATQVSPDGTRTRLSCRISASDVGELDLGLPPEAILEQAAVDGQPAAVRRDAQRLLLTLPGRTLVRLVLRYTATAVDGRIAVPRLGGLPVTRSTWTLAIDPSLRAEVLSAADLMPLRRRSEPGDTRVWLGSWHAAPAASLRIGPVSAVRTIAASDDPRVLLPPPASVRPDGEPQIDLHGALLTGARSGAPQAAGLVLTPLADLHRADALGRILAIMLGLSALFVPRRALVLLLPVAVAAVPLGVALLAWQAPIGPLLALCEWLPFATACGLLGRWLQLPRRLA